MRAVLGRWSAALLAAALAGCASAPVRGPSAAEEIVEAEGWAPLGPDAAGARRKALLDAQRRAIERVVGVSLQVSTKVEAAVLERQRIRAAARGRIKRYEILREFCEGGFRKALIRAVVSRSSEDEDGRPPEDAPVSLVVQGEDPAGAAAAAAALEESLTERGFRVVREGAGPRLRLRGTVRLERADDPRLGSMSASSALLTVQAVEAGSGRLVWSRSAQAASLGLDELRAGLAASRAAAAAMGREASQALAAVLWEAP